MFRRGVLLFILALIAISPVNAAGDAKKLSAFASYTVGQFKVVALQDGTITIGTAAYSGAPQAQIQALAEQANAADRETPVNAYLIDTGTERILIDAGNASCYGWVLGGLEDSLRQAGYTPDDIGMVFLTHLHGDHVCGLLKDGKCLFPKAAVYVAEEEAAYWFDPSRYDSNAARAPLAAYGKEFRTFHAGEKIRPWLSIVPAHGHTPGHTAYLIGSEGQQLLLWGDIVHCAAIQFPRPDLSIVSDADSGQAIATRKTFLEKVSKENLLIAGAHLPFPGIGYVRRIKNGYAWEPFASPARTLPSQP